MDISMWACKQTLRESRNHHNMPLQLWPLHDMEVSRVPANARIVELSACQVSLTVKSTHTDHAPLERCRCQCKAPVSPWASQLSTCH